MVTSSDKPLSFEAICSLLDALEDVLNRYQAPKHPITRPVFKSRQRKQAVDWAKFYQSSIVKDSQSTLSVLGLLFPDLRRERVYVLKEHTLSAVLARAVGMGREGLERLRNWRLENKDFGYAVEKEMKKGEGFLG